MQRRQRPRVAGRHCLLAILIVTTTGNIRCCLAQRDPMWNYPPELAGADVEVYKQVGDVGLKAWIFQPERVGTASKRPAIVFFFGGGWRGGTPGQFDPQCRYLASRGMVAITVDYRVRSRHDVLAPVCVADAKSAIRWVRANAERLGVDPDRIVASGGSAGGHLAACTGSVPGFDDRDDKLTISAVPNAMALYNPAVLLCEVDGGHQIDPKKLADLSERTGGQATAISPITHVRGNLPPSIIFHGTNDEAVPFWTVERFAAAMTDAGNRCELKAYSGAPHGFFNTGRGGSAERQDLERQRYAQTTRQLDEFLQSLGYLKGPATIAATDRPHIALRSDFANSRRRFESDGEGHVAFIGGSITEMNGYRPMVVKSLTERFPKTKFTFTDAGIASTCSTTGAFRLGRDVSSKGPVDLFFIEFAVNDDQDAGHAARECVRGMEGIVRQVLDHNPRADMVITHFVNPGMLKTVQSGETPLSSGSHEQVARHYGVSTINLAAEVARQIADGELTWKQYGGTHPKPHGNAICAEMIRDLLDAAWSVPARAVVPGEALPGKPLDSLSYSRGRFLSINDAEFVDGWTIGVPDWKSLPGSSRRRFTELPILSGSKPGAALRLTFDGTAIGAYVLAGPDAGTVEVSIDGGAFRSIDLYHRFSKGLHYPRTVMFENSLQPGTHTLRLRISESHNQASSGHAVRIMEFAAN